MALPLPAILTPPDGGAPGYCRARRVFLTLVGVLVALAFVGLWRQFPGLIGERGVAPAEATVAAWSGGFLRYPSLLALGAGDWLLHGLCAIGTLSGVALVLGFVPRWAALVAWVAYLSLFHGLIPMGSNVVPGEFDSLFAGNWDLLLLEVLLLSVFLAPGGGLRPGALWQKTPHPAAHFLMRWLLFRVLLQSGLTKLWLGSDLWVSGSSGLRRALVSESLTTPAGLWLVNAAPGMLYGIGVVWAVLECVAAVAILFPSRLRVVRQFGALLAIAVLAFEWLMFHQGTLPLLGMTLAVLLLDDRLLRAPTTEDGAAPRVPLVAALGWVGAVVFAFVSLLQWIAIGERPPDQPAGIWSVLDPARRFASCNSYERHWPIPEGKRVWILEAQNRPGTGWHPYSWRSLPGVTSRGPSWHPLDVPRLQFEVARKAHDVSRFRGFQFRLIRGLYEREPAILDSFASVPFDDVPATIRVVVYAYAPAVVGAADAWQRGVASRDDGKLLIAPVPPQDLGIEGATRPEPADGGGPEDGDQKDSEKGSAKKNG